MAAIASSKRVFYALVLFCLTTLVTCRPQTTIDSQDPSDQDSTNEIQRLYNAYSNFPSANMMSPEDRMAWNRLQYEMIAHYIQNSMPSGGWPEQIYRAPEIKRQVRYRQCYFNPISCFRK
ncbi:CLUMA_CG007843, isoform A [Clunio marinus]|uniref:CLUMA_CG007843, isoform A n=1 Tax=Clunio marinus TaxID=568069 RepID=A0A1J1I1X8_9DIPT|nr:CLUMA_CG007843, isoform A [Clunio marinus]